MSNYKNIKFDNTREGFKSYCSNFPSVWKDSTASILGEKVSKKGNNYAEIKAVEDNGFKFISIDTRQYDPESFNFEPDWDNQELFTSEIDKLKERFNINTVL